MPQPRLCPFLSIVTMAKEPSAIITPKAEPPGMQPIGCAQLACALFIPFRDDASDKLIGGECSFLVIGTALMQIHQTMEKQRAGELPQPPPRPPLKAV